MHTNNLKSRLTALFFFIICIFVIKNHKIKFNCVYSFNKWSLIKIFATILIGADYMYSKNDLINDLNTLNINKEGTLMVHSSYKAIGDVLGRADTVVDSLIEYMEKGLLVIPTHTWRIINAENPVFNVLETPTNIGIITELFRKRPGVIRSYHPTHSVGALGKGSMEFIKDDHKFDTPCNRKSSYGKLLDKNAQILLIGVDLKRNTYIHGIEEWLDIEDELRLSTEKEQLKSVLPDGSIVSVPSRRHQLESWSEYFYKVEEILINQKAIHVGKFGDARALLCDARRMFEVLKVMLEDNPKLFNDDKPLDDKVIEYYSKITI